MSDHQSTPETKEDQQFTVAPDRVTMHLLIDAGNQLCASMAVIGHTVTEPILFPSVLSLRGANSSQLLASRGTDSLEQDEYTITRNGKRGTAIETYVGELAYTASSWENNRGNPERYSDSEWNANFVYVAAALHAPYAKHITARITTMVPPALWGDQQTKVKAMLLNNKQPHAYTFRGRDITLVVPEVHVEREGHVAWWALPKEKRDGYSLLLDWGGGTLNATLVDESSVIIGEPVTFDRLGLETILDDITTELDRPLLPGEREGLKHALRDNQSYSIYVDGEMVNVSNRALDRIDTAAAQIAAVIKPRFKAATLRALKRVVLFGGTAHVAKEALTSHFPTLLTVLDAYKPELVNLIGAAFKANVAEAMPDGTLAPTKGRNKPSRTNKGK